MATRINAVFDWRLPVSTAISYAPGARINGAQAGSNEVTVHSGHSIATGDKFLYGLTDGNILVTRTFVAGTVTATTVPFTLDSFSFPDNGLLIGLGADTGGTQKEDGSYNLPNYDGSTITMYSDSAGDDSVASIVVGPDKDAGHYASTAPIWILGLSSGLKPVSVLIDIGSASGTITMTRGTALPTSPELGDEHVLVTAGANPDIKYIYMKLADETSNWVEVVSAP